MSFMRRLFGGKFIEVPDKWGVGDGTPLLAERSPDLESIFSNPNPQPPQRLTPKNRGFWEKQGQRSIRYAHAMAYLSHPDPQVRAATIQLVKEFDAIGISQMLVDLLADPSEFVGHTAAEAIWDKAKSSAPETNSVAFAIRCLRDEIQQTGQVSHMNPKVARQAFELLLSVRPDRKADFFRWCMYAWCRSDEHSAQLGYKLLDLHSKHRTFLGNAEEASRQIGSDIGSFREMQAVHDAIRFILGSAAARELEGAWSGIGSWR